jgi:hypothetical protein
MRRTYPVHDLRRLRIRDIHDQDSGVREVLVERLTIGSTTDVGVVALDGEGRVHPAVLERRVADQFERALALAEAIVRWDVSNRRVERGD